MAGGAPLGNKNGAKSRLFEQALIRAIKQRDLELGEGETLRGIAEALLDKCKTADMQAIKELGDRLDGKPAQTIAGDDENPLRLISRIERVIVDSPKD